MGKPPEKVFVWQKLFQEACFMSNEETFNHFTRMLELRGFTEGTTHSYIVMYKRFEAWCEFNSINIREITYEQVQLYVLYLKNVIKYAPKTVNSNISFIRFLFTYVLARSLDRYMLPYSKFDQQEAEILTPEEVITFIQALPNLKAKAILTLMYSCGLRVSEVVNLKYENVSRKRMTVYIEHTKNRSARHVPLSEAALKVLTQYWLECGRPKGWLFPGAREGTPLRKDTVFAYIKETKERLNWQDRRITSHTFRHCLGTHMYEAGYDLPYIQKFLGHKCITSTMVYITLTGRRDYPLLLDTMVSGDVSLE